MRTQRTIFLIVLIVATMALFITLAGVSRIWPPQNSVLMWNIVPVHIFFTAFAAVLIATISKCLRIDIIASALVATFIIAIITGQTAAWLVALIFFISSYFLGHAVLTTFRAKFSSSSFVKLVLIGAAAYGFIVGLLAHFPVNYPGTYGLLLALPVLASWRSVQVNWRALLSGVRSESSPDLKDLAIGSIFVCLFTVSLMPEVGFDSLVMHLFVPNYVAAQHFWSFDVENYIWAVMPMHGTWLYTLVNMLGGETSARILNIGFLGIACSLVRDCVLWARGNQNGAKWGVLVFITTPLTYAESSTLFVELIWTAFVVAGSLQILYVIQHEDEQGDVVSGGILLGAALATKAVTFMTLPALLGVFIFNYRKWLNRYSVRSLISGLSLLTIFGCVPYFTAWRLTGNPVFPFFNAVFKSALTKAENFEPPVIFSKGIAWNTLYQITFDTGKFLEARPGASGFQWTLLFVPILLTFFGWKNRRGLVFYFFAISAIYLTFHSTAYLRYIFPSFLWVAAAIGLACASQDLIPATRRLFKGIALITIVLNLTFFIEGTYYGDLSKEPVFSEEGRSTYLKNRLPIREAVKAVNALNPEKTPVAIFAAPQAAGINSDILSPGWHNPKFSKQLQDAKTGDAIAEMLLDRGVFYLLVDDNWDQTEKRIKTEEATDLVGNVGPIAIRKISKRYLFQKELLNNNDFKALAGWSSPNPIVQLEDGVLATVTSPVFQEIPITGGKHYLQLVQVQCASVPTQARLQVNWLNKKSKLVKSDLQVFDCKADGETLSREVIAPRDATTAVVYGSGHTENSVLFRKVSFKQ